MTRYLRPALLALFFTLTACISDAHGQGWPGERNAVPAQLAGASDILALEFNQQGGATTALCSLKWEALQ